MRIGDRLAHDPALMPAAPAAINNLMGILGDRGPIKVGAVTYESEVRIGLPEPIPGFLRFLT